MVAASIRSDVYSSPQADIQYLKEQTYELRRGMQERRSTQYFGNLNFLDEVPAGIKANAPH